MLELRTEEQLKERGLAEDLLLGIDIGTSAVKAALVDLRGTLEAAYKAEYRTVYPCPNWAEQNPDDWWRATCDAVSRCLAEVAFARDRILALAVSSQGPTLLPLDISGRPLRPAIIWMDRRAENEARQLMELVGNDNIYSITGNRTDCFFVAPRLLWMKAHEPESLSRTFRFVQANGYINYLLTGSYSIDTSHAALLQLQTHSTGIWSDVLCAACGVQPNQFPEVYPATHILGRVTDRASAETGLKTGIPVMVGTIDSSAAALEAGLFESGIAVEMAGTSTVLIFANRKGLTEPALISEPHAVPGIQLMLGAMVSSGASLRWFADEIDGAKLQPTGERKADPFHVLTSDAAQIRAGSNGVLFLPYMMGERSPLWHTNARGVFFGLSLNTCKAALVRAILEGVAFSLRQNMEIAQRAGAEVTELRSVGGCSRSDVWNQIKADVLGRKLSVPRTSTGAAYGAAILAGMGAGIYSDLHTSLPKLVKLRRHYNPCPKTHDHYNRVYEVFQKVYRHLKGDFDAMAEITLAA